MDINQTLWWEKQSRPNKASLFLKSHNPSQSALPGTNSFFEATCVLKSNMRVEKCTRHACAE